MTTFQIIVLFLISLIYYVFSIIQFYGIDKDDISDFFACLSLMTVFILFILFLLPFHIEKIEISHYDVEKIEMTDEYYVRVSTKNETYYKIKNFKPNKIIITKKYNILYMFAYKSITYYGENDHD